MEAVCRFQSHTLLPSGYGTASTNLAYNDHPTTAGLQGAKRNRKPWSRVNIFRQALFGAQQLAACRKLRKSGGARCRHQRRKVVRSLAKGQEGPGSRKEPELDVAVFRFTLGIPGLEDALLPRILGCLVGVLLLGNHLATPAPIAEAQLRSEALGVVLAALACTVPYFSQRLQEGRAGRRVSSSAADGAAREVFALDLGLSPGTKQQLAWTTYSLLKNTRTKTVLISNGRRVLCARGSVSASTPQAALLNELTAAVEKGGAKEIARTKRYLSDRGALASAGLDRWSFVPPSIASAYFQTVPGGEGFVALLSDEPRFVTAKERIWIEGLASRMFVNESRQESEHGAQIVPPE